MPTRSRTGLFFLALALLLAPAWAQRAVRLDRQLQMRVTDQTGRPASHAEAWFMDTDVLLSRDHRPELQASWNLEMLMRRGGVRLPVDDRGHTSLPRFRYAAIIAAKRPGQWNARVITLEEQTPFNLQLQPETGLTVNVVSATGQPVSGVTVAAEFAELANHRQPWARWQAVSRGHGVARLEHLSSDFLTSKARGARPRTVVVSVSGIQDPPITKVIDLQGLERIDDAPSITLRLPPMGRLMVELSQGDGQPYRGMSRVWLSDGENRWPSPGFLTTTGLAAINVPANGRELFVEAMSLDFEYETASRAIRMPLAPGQTLSTRLTFAERSALLSGRAIGPHGRPISGRRLQVEFTRQGDSGAPLTITSDEVQLGTSGLLRLRVPSEIKHAPWFRARIRPAGYRMNHEVEAALEFTGIRPGGTTYLGDVRFGARPILAAGRLMDTSGSPIPGARVSTTGVGADQDTVLEITDIDGRFRIHGTTPSESIDLHIEKAGAIERTTRSVRRGDDEIELRVPITQN